MDLAYLRRHPEHLPTFLTHQRIRETPVPGGDSCVASRLTLDDGTSLFAKTWPAGSPVPEGFFAVEAAGLRWLREAGAMPVPEVFAALPDLLALEWVEPGEPSEAAAARFGHDLAHLHRAGAAAFGGGATVTTSGGGATVATSGGDATVTTSGGGGDQPGFIGRLPQDNTPSPGPWGLWFGQRRLLPYLRRSVDAGALDAATTTLVERVVDEVDGYDDGEPPARLHGDLWPGNVLWAADGRVWLVDPAAHGGHRETDLAQLALFGGAPHLPVILAAYQEVWPLPAGWRARVPLHQLHLLLVHTALFGAGYAGSVRRAARAALRS